MFHTGPILSGRLFWRFKSTGSLEEAGMGRKQWDVWCVLDASALQGQGLLSQKFLVFLLMHSYILFSLASPGSLEWPECFFVPPSSTLWLEEAGQLREEPNEAFDNICVPAQLFSQPGRL